VALNKDLPDVDDPACRIEIPLLPLAAGLCGWVAYLFDFNVYPLLSGNPHH